MNIIGTNFHGHDSAIVQIDCDKRLIRARSVERVTRIKHDHISPDFKHQILQKQVSIVCVSFNRFSKFLQNFATI